MVGHGEAGLGGVALEVEVEPHLGRVLGELAHELGEDRVGAGVEAEPVGRVVAGELGLDLRPSASRRASAASASLGGGRALGRLSAWLPPVRTSRVSL